jgi:hypothetical protein
MKAKLRPDHPFTLAAMYNLATCYQATGKPNEALTLLKEGYRLESTTVGANHRDTQAFFCGEEMTAIIRFLVRSLTH